MYVYLSNEQETPVDVFFDDLTVTHQHGPVVQADDYYPFGLTFNSYVSGDKNKYLYQGKELQDELGLGTFDFDARMYDAAIGRTFQPDPHAENYVELSSYSWTGNNPVTNIDPDGRDWYRYTDDDGNESVIWQEGDAKTIDVDGQTYTNIGNGYIKKLDDGSRVIYYQNEVFGVIDANEKAGSDPAKWAANHRMIDSDADVRSNSITDQWDMLFFASEAALMITGEAGTYQGLSRRSPSSFKKAPRGQNHTIESVAEMSTRVPNNKGAKILSNSGSASATFKKMALHYKPSKIHTSGSAKYFHTNDGRTVTLRSSSGDKPTISIQTKGVGRQTKIRFSHD